MVHCYYQLIMKQSDKVLTEAELQKKAVKAQKTIYGLMCVLIVFPFVVAWLTGAFRW